MYRRYRRLGAASLIVDIALAEARAQVETVVIGREPVDPPTPAARRASRPPRWPG